ncbi:MAG: hypothetical protein ACRDHU_08100 [Actinomycetota bacterium]
MDDTASTTWRPWVLASIDALVVVLSYLVALVARFTGSVPGEWGQRFWAFILPVVAVSLSINVLFGLDGPGRRPARAVLAGLVTAVVVVVVTVWVRAVPLSVAAGGGVVAALGFAGVRLAVR